MANAAFHSFNVDIATQYGVEAAIVLHHLFFWIDLNRRQKKNFHQGKYWMYQTQKEMCACIPYFNEDKIYRILSYLEEKGVIKKGNFNQTSFDRTVWYSLVNEEMFTIPQKCGIENADSRNRKSENAECIYKETDTETDTGINRTAKAEASASVSDAARRLVNIFIEKIKERDPNFKEPNRKKWALVFDRIHRIDGRSFEEIEQLLLFSQNHEFWSGVILSPESFRKATSKLFMQYKATTAKSQPETRKESKFKENAAYAKQMALLDEDRIFVDETTITIVINRNRKENCVIPFNEEGFHEQLGSALRKAGIV